MISATAAFAQPSAAIAGYTTVPLISSASNHDGVEAGIGGRKGFLLLDTGAPVSLLTRGFYKQAVISAGVHTPDGAGAALKVNGTAGMKGWIPDLELGGLKLPGMWLAVADLPGGIVSIHDRRIDGILGENVLVGTAAIIDWRRRAVYFNTERSKRIKLGELTVRSGWTAVPMTFTNGRHFCVPCQLGTDHFELIVDTGASFTAMDSRLLHYGRVISKYGRLPLKWIGDITDMAPVELQDMRIGNYVVQAANVAGGRLPAALVAEKAPSGAPILGLLGSELLARNNALIDCAGMALYLKAK